jgi:hypothetical protein
MEENLPKPEKPQTTVTLVVEYDNTIPDRDAIVELLNSARSYGGIRSATMVISNPDKIDLIKAGY